jgi:hypothetical protein
VVSTQDLSYALAGLGAVMEVWLLEIVSPKCAGRLLVCGTEEVGKRLFKPQECYTTKNIKALVVSPSACEMQRRPLSAMTVWGSEINSPRC